MKLNHGLHLAYSTNIHRGESWAEIFHALQTHTLAVRDRVCPHEPFAIGLRLSARAAGELNEPAERLKFRRWLDANGCYVFTFNGFPYGQFHDTRVKEQVYRPDWTSPERVAYTNLLFDLLAEFLPADIDRRFGQYNMPDHGLLLTNLVHWAAKDNIPLKVEGKGVIDCHLYQQPGRMVMHLVNLTNSARWRAPIHELISVGPFKVQVKLPQGVHAKSLRLLVSNQPVASTLKNGWVSFEVKSILDHEVVVLA